MFHAPLSASQTHRWLHCPGSIPFIEQLRDYVPAKSSVFADEGTHAHHILDYQLQCIYKGRVPLETDPEIVEYKDQWALDVAIEYIQDRMDFNPGAAIFLENYVQPLPDVKDCGGTADIIILTKNELEIIDYKHGRGVYVSPDWNSQLLTYALGSLNMTDIPVKRVRTTIVQPRHGEAVRNSPQQNGVLSEIYNIADIRVIFEIELRQGVQRVREAQKLCEDPRYSLVKAYAEGYLNPGPERKACKFCDLKTMCPATTEAVVDAKAVFAEFQEMESATSDILSEENIVRIKYLYSMAASLKDIASQAEEVMKTLLEDEELKENFPEFKLINSYGHRRWAKPIAEVIKILITEYGMKKADCYKVDPKSPAQMEKELPKSLRDMLKASEYITKPITGKKIVSN